MTGFSLPSIPRSFLRTGLGLGLALGLWVGGACNINAVSVFTCTTTEECVEEAGMGALCEPNNLCTVPDAACMMSMKRWHDRAGDLAGKCYEDADLIGDDTAAGTAGSGTEGTGESDDGDPATTTGADGSTTDPVEDTGPGDTTGDPPATDDGATTTGGMGMACIDLFGDVPAYMLCEETDESCKFNGMTNDGSCADLCMMFGSKCIDGFSNTAGDCASEEAQVGCDQTAGDNICVCAK